MNQRSGCPSPAWCCCANTSRHCAGAVTVTTRCTRAWWRSSSQTYWDPYPVSQPFNLTSHEYRTHLIVLVFDRYATIPTSDITTSPNNEQMIQNFRSLVVIYITNAEKLVCENTSHLHLHWSRCYSQNPVPTLTDAALHVQVGQLFV